MFNRRQLIEYACPECDAGFAGPESSAGSNMNCNHCKTDFMIPTGLQPKLLTVGTDSGRALTPEETEVVRKSLAVRMQTRERRQVVAAEFDDDEFDGELVMPRRRPARVDDDKQVELGFGE